MTGAGYRVVRTGDEQQQARLVGALRCLARKYRERAQSPRDLSDTLNRATLLDLAIAADELAEETLSQLAVACAT
ncbi:MAG: hypothetical protein ACK5UQ_02300 [Planctomycetota bacterium]|jgi:hypothetical protein